MRSTLFILSSILILSCTDRPLSEHHLVSQSGKYYLNFQIFDNLYNPDEQDSTTVFSIQDLDFEMEFTDAYRSRHQYPYFYIDQSPSDSFDIIGTIQCIGDSDFGFESQQIDFEIVLREHISNLEYVTDSTFTFKSNEQLYHRLKEGNFGQKNLFGNDDKSSIFITMPSDSISNLDIVHATNSSNGFYFEHEYLEFTNLVYNEDLDYISLTGNFEVELKQLSCGFYSTHLLSNAEFNLLIQ